MSIDYKGHHARTGYLTHVTNTIDNKKYSISTAPKIGGWETAVFKRTLFGGLSPLMRVWAQDETQAPWVHDQVEKIAEQRKPADWEDAKSELINSDCSPGQTALQLMARGVAYGMKGDHDRAIAEYNEAIRLEPNDAFLFAARGGAYGLKEQYDRALADYGEAMRLSPKETHLSPEIDASFLCGRGEVYLGKGDEDCAIADFDQAIRLDPKAAPAFFGRGRAHNNKGHHDRAIADLDEAIRLNAKKCDYFCARGDAYLDKGDNDRAIADYDDAIRLEPNFPRAIFFRRQAILRKGDELAGGPSTEAPSESTNSQKCSTDTCDAPDATGTAEIEGNAYGSTSKTAAGPLWEYFRGKPNTQAVLQEKAGVVTALIIQFWDSVLVIAAVFKEHFKDTMGEEDARQLILKLGARESMSPQAGIIGEEDARQIIAETVAFLLSVIDRLAFKYLGSKNRDIFMDWVETGVAGALGEKRAREGGAAAALEFAISFHKLINGRYQEYAPYKNYYGEEIHREFIKKVSGILSVGQNAVLDLTLRHDLIRFFVDLNLDELLPE